VSGVAVSMTHADHAIGFDARVLSLDGCHKLWDAARKKGREEIRNREQSIAKEGEKKGPWLMMAGGTAIVSCGGLYSSTEMPSI